MNKIRYIILFFILVCGCGKKNETIIVAEKSDMIIHAIDESIIESLSLSVDKTDIVFIVDASCSICIGNFLDELLMIKELEWEKTLKLGKLFVLSPEGTSKIVRHYVVEQSLVDISSVNFIEIKDNFLIEKYNGFFYVMDNGICSEMWTPKY